MRVCAAIVFSLIASAVSAQYANSWVSYNQPYYKIQIATTGLYRLTYNQLQQAGVPVTSIDPRLIQIYHRGVEQAIIFKHDQSPADANFDTNEYLEFYGKRNDGVRDAGLYQPASLQPHQYYNIFSDTSAYFLTVNTQLVQGKRMSVFDQVNSTSIPKEVSHQDERLSVFTSEYSFGDIIDGYILQTYFDEGEGWTGFTICTLNSDCAGNEQRDFPMVDMTNAITSESPPTLELQLAGRDHLQHQAEIYVGPDASSLRLLTTRNFINFQTPVITVPLNWSDVGGDGKMVVRVKGIGVGGVRERLSVSYIRVMFAQGFNMNSATSKTFHLNPNGGGKSYVELANAPADIRVFDITDPTDIVQIGTRTAGPLITAVVANTSTSRTLYVANTFLTPDVTKVKKVNFRNLNTASDFLIITHRSLMQPALSYSNPVAAYAAYRASSEGGGYDTLTVTIDQLYDQFNYGETSPTAIYEFMKYMVGKGDPQYLFLIGKGREANASMYRRSLTPTESRDLVPSAGIPGSDMAFSAGLKGQPFVPAVPTGRLTAVNPAQVAAYLNKVMEAEAQPFNELWRKKVLHLSGGIKSNELVLFRGYMQGFADIAKRQYLGGDVLTLGKHGVSNIEFFNISKEINAGVNLVTFFGHSSSNATDIDIGYVSEPILGYNNVGKYPAFLVNGCSAGEFFNDGMNFAEDWTMAPSKGARNFIANSSFGFDIGLRQYTTYFYDVGFGDSVFISKGIGDVQKETARRFLAEYGNTKSTYTAQVQQMMLLGDPSLKLFGPTKPDYETSDAAISVVAYDDKPIHALTDSLQLQIVTKNLGRSTQRKLRVKVIHSVNDLVTAYDTLYNSVLLQDTLKVTLRRGTGNFFGNNRIEVFVDPVNEIAELNEENNDGVWSKFIQFNGTQNLQPADFGIVSSTSPPLLFQDTDVLAGVRTYIVQIDTTKAFTSPFMQSKSVTGNVLLKANFDLTEEDSIVYYWRSKRNDAADDQWETTSFSYIRNGENGWAQLAYDQMLENSFNGLKGIDAFEKFEFERTNVSVFLKTFGSANTTPGNSASFQVNSAEYFYSPQGFNCRTNTINLVAFDRSSVVPYLGVPFTFENSFGRACGREPMLINSFTPGETSTGNHDDLIEYINNLKAGDSVILFTLGDAGFSAWSPEVRTKIGEIGIQATDIDDFILGEPVIILGKKGASPGTARIIRSDQSPPDEQELQLSEDLTGYGSSGSMTSLLIGPALKWHSLTPRFTLDDPLDEIDLDVYGIGLDGKETLFFENLVTGTDLSTLDVASFPYVRLVFTTRDLTDLTPTTLRNWIVTYDPAPDGLLLFDGPAGPVDVEEGSTHTSKFKFVNITTIDFVDSLASTFTVVNRLTGARESQQFNIKGPLAGDTTHFEKVINTTGKVGLNDLSATVNSNVVIEQYFQNNAIEISGYLNVLKDRINPILDVTVDGRFLSNGDFVSANPLIVVRLRDENILRPIKDTTSLNLLMTRPCNTAACQAQRINFSGNDVKWKVIDGGLVVEYRPTSLAAGTYELFANGMDVSGNPSGAEPYHVAFVVEESVGVVFYPPYPNPSAVGFFFEFAAAGEAAPESFVLQIINRSGQDVATFTETDAPALRVGINQLKWSGLDAQGNRLSDGLYFYQLRITTSDGEFKNSGRLSILR